MFGRVGRVLFAFLLAAMGAAPARRCRADAPSAVVVAQPLVREKRGIAGGLGLGSEYAGAGVQVRYEMPMRPWLHVAPFVGAGWFVTSSWRFDAGVAGLATGLGYRNRLAVTLAVAPIFVEGLDLHGTLVDKKVIYGPNALLGYEHMIDTGYFQRIAIGYGWGVWRRSDAYSPREFTFTFGTGMRLW